MRFWNGRTNLMLLAIVGFLASIRSVSARDMERELLGAWATSASDCAKTFERRGENWVFRQPIDEFAQAAIIESERIVAPTGTCEVKGVARTNDVLTVTGVCDDSVSYMNRTAQIIVKGKDEIVYSPTGDPALNTDFQRCLP